MAKKAYVFGVDFVKNRGVYVNIAQYGLGLAVRVELLNGLGRHRLRFEELFQVAQMVNGIFAETFDKLFQITKFAFQFVELFVMKLFFT